VLNFSNENSIPLVNFSKTTIMKQFTITICIALLFAFAFPANAQMTDSATMMKNWMNYMTPSKEHKMMESWNGTWTGEISMWMAPGAPPTKSNGIATNTMLLGGRYQQSSYKSMFNNMPFEGMSTLAFDNAKKVFISTWIDNMGTGIMVGEGPWDETTKTITLKGNMVDPTSGSNVAFHENFKVIDNDHQLMEMFVPGPDGNEMKTMEVKYTRKK
jgi:hypothetical protein